MIKATAGLARKKLSILVGLIILGYLCIVVRLIQLQIGEHQQFTQLCQKNYTRFCPTASLRGNIVDCKGELLATNRPVLNLFWKSTGKKKLTPEQLDLISGIQKIGQEGVLSELQAHVARHERAGKSLLLINDMSMEQLSVLMERFAHHPNVHIDYQYQRFYPHGDAVCHIVGYLGRDQERWGKMGLEKTFEGSLQGSGGLVCKIVNSTGVVLQESSLRQALSGDSITTTLDLSLQLLAKEVFGSEHTGAFLIMDQQTGALKAAVSRPSFDPGIFCSQVTSAQWADLQVKKPFINRCFQAMYPPASLFKLVMIALAFDQGLVEPDSYWFCKGFTTFCKRKYYCINKTGHGYISLYDLIAVSCNTLFFELARGLSIDTIAQYARRFGLGSKTGIVLPEGQGLIPDTAWKKEVKGTPWWPGETLSAAIGQSYLLVTPLQIARMVAGVVEGYLVKPRLLADEPIVRTPLEINPKARTFLRKSMKQVAKKGTARRLNPRKDYKLFVKTGTAQTCELGKGDLGGQYQPHGWFAGSFQYQDGPPMVMVIVLENAGTTRPVIDIARAFLRRYPQVLSAAG